MTPERARRLIDRLQAKADSTPFAGEREALLAKVAELRLSVPPTPEPPPPASAPAAPFVMWTTMSGTMNTATPTNFYAWTVTGVTANNGPQGWQDPPDWNPPAGMREPRRPNPSAGPTFSARVA